MFEKLLQYSPVQMLSALSVFALISMQTAYLSPEQYGLMAALILILEIMRSLGSQWINDALLRLYPSEGSIIRQYYLFLSQKLLLILFVPSSLLMALIIYLFSEFRLNIWAAFTFLLVAKLTFLYFLEICRINNKIRKYRRALLLHSTSSLFFTFIFLEYSSTIISSVLGLGLSYIFSLLFVLQKFEPKPNGDFSSQKKSYLTYGVSMALAGVLSVLSARADRFLVGKFIGFEYLGSYAAMSNILFGLASLTFMVVALPLYPEITKTANDAKKLKHMHGNYLDILLFVNIPFTLGICLISTPLFSLLLGADYNTNGVILVYLIALAAFFFNLKLHFADHGLQFRLKTQLLPVIVFVGVLLNILLVYWGLNTLGIIGVGVAALITQILIFGATIFAGMKNDYNFPMPKNIGKTLLAALIMTGFDVYLMSRIEAYTNINKILIISGVSLIIYFTVHLALNTFNCRNYIFKRIKK